MKNVRFFKGQKYHNKSCVCGAGHKHDSVMEANYCDDLHVLLKAGEIREIQSQVSFPIAVEGNHICNHIVDFVVVNKTGNPEIHEVKGFATDVWALKHKLFLAVYPKMPYHVITKDARYDPYNKISWRKRRNSKRSSKGIF